MIAQVNAKMEECASMVSANAEKDTKDLSANTKVSKFISLKILD